MNNTIKISIISAALISSLSAQNQYTLENIEVTASQGTTLEKKDVTDSVTIITKEAIEESHVTTLDEALNKLGGLSMTQNGGAGTRSSIFIRGMSSKRLLVLIDGVRYNEPAAIDSVANFSQLALYNVEQIEIIKGAQSGIWGSDASGGVINIITSKAKKGLHGVINAEYGSFNTLNTSLIASYATDKYDITIAGLSYTTDGFSAVEKIKSDPDYGKRYDELGFEKDQYINTTLNVTLGYNITQNDRVELKVQSIDTLVEYDDTPWPTYLPADSNIPQSGSYSRFYNLSYSHNDSINDLKFNYNLSKFSREALGTWGSSSFVSSVEEIKMDDKITYDEESFVRFGASYQKFKQEEVTANTDKEYSAISVFATNYNKFQIFSDLNTIITESVRFDEYDEFDNSLTGKLGLKQFFYKDFYVSANAGTGFNAPTLGQLYGAFGANPDLKPEKSLTSDITLGNDTIWITAFYNEITDLIEYDFALGYVQTSGKSKFEGVEIGYEDYFGDTVGVNAMYTYTKTEDADGKALARRPKTQIDAAVTYYVSDDFDLGLNAQYIGTRYDKADNQGAQTGEYIVSNFVTNVEVNKHVTIYGKINNLSDKYYQTVDGYATAGRSLYLGLNAKY